MHHHHWRTVITVLSVVTFWTSFAGLLFWVLQRRFHYISEFINEKRTAFDLAVFRIVLMSVYLATFHPLIVLNFSQLDSALVVPPMGWGRVATWIPRSVPAAVGIDVLFVICTCLALVGLQTRVMCWLAVLSNFYLLSIPQLFGKINHNHHLVLFGFLLCLSPCGDALSVDAFLARRKGKGIPTFVAATRYARPIQAVLVLMGVMYFYPGVWKIARNGFGWFTGSNLHYIMIDKLAELGPSPFQHWVANNGPLLIAGSVFTILFEMGWVVLALNRRTRIAAIILGLAFHNLTRVLMNISFVELQLCYLFLIDWTAVLRFFSPRVRAMQLSARQWLQTVPAAWSERSLGRSFKFTAALFATGMILAGMSHSLTAWPVACYPTFEDTSPNVEAITKLDLVTTEGQVDHMAVEFDPLMQARFAPERWRGMIDSLSGSGQRTAALVRLWTTVHHRTDAVGATVYSDMYDLSTKPPRLILHTVIGSVKLRNRLAASAE